MERRRRHPWLIAAALIAVALTMAAVAAGAQAPSRPVQIEPAPEAGREVEKVIPYGHSQVLLVDRGFGESPPGITRVNLDGSIDRSFGDEGTVQIAAEDAAVTRDGRIFVATSSAPEGGGKGKARVTCLLPDGQLDTSFGGGGNADVSFGPNGRGQTVAVAPNGDILLGGVRVDSEGSPASAYISEFDLGVARLKPNGSPDRSFGRSGVKILAVEDEIEAIDIAATPSGGVVVEEGNEISAYIGKLDRHGAVDRHFGDHGWIAIQGKRGKSGARQWLLPTPGFAELASGKLLVAASGTYRDGGTKALALRLRADGRVDRSFGNAGWAQVPGRTETSASGLTSLPGGAVALATAFEPGKGASNEFGAVVFGRDGRLDRKFAAHGTCRAPIPGQKGFSGVLVADVGGRPVALASGGASSEWLLRCPPARPLTPGGRDPTAR